MPVQVGCYIGSRASPVQDSLFIPAECGHIRHASKDLVSIESRNGKRDTASLACAFCYYSLHIRLGKSYNGLNRPQRINNVFAKIEIMLAFNPHRSHASRGASLQTCFTSGIPSLKARVRCKYTYSHRGPVSVIIRISPVSAKPVIMNKERDFLCVHRVGKDFPGMYGRSIRPLKSNILYAKSGKRIIGFF